MNIGLVPMAAKPYHAGHHALVEKAARENDKVFVYVSLSDRKRKNQLPILGSDMLNIWKTQIESILPGNVIPVYGGAGSPVQKVYKALEHAEAENSDDVYRVYSDPEDTARNYPETSRMKSFPTMHQSGNVIFAAEEDPDSVTRGVGTPDISGTAVRDLIQCGDFESFSKFMPDGVDKEAVFNTLCPLSGQNETYLREYINEIIRR
jgi:hypothetical protein